MRARLQDLGNSTKKVTEYEEKIFQYSQELERLNSLLGNKSENVTQYENRLKTITLENEDLKRRMLEFTNVNRKLAEYENRIALMTQEIQRLQEKASLKNEENLELQSRLRGLADELESSRRGKSEFEYRITQINQEWQSKITTYESRITMITQENEGLKKRLSDGGEVSRKVG